MVSVKQRDGITMKKNIITIIFITIFASMAFTQQHDNENNFTVEIINNGRAVRITGYVGNNTVVRIPPRIRNLPVTEIGRLALN